MDLAQLTFRTSTQELLDAKNAIDNLAKAMGNLNKASADESKVAINSAKVKEAEAKALAETLLVEPFTKCEVNTIAEVLAQHLELDKYKLTTSLISENIAPSKYSSALYIGIPTVIIGK